MTSSPVLATLLPLVSLALLGWPLAGVIRQEPAQQQATEESLEDSPIRSADLIIRSAHPFTSVKVTIGETSWTFDPEEDLKEILFPYSADQSSVTLHIEVQWPGSTPETALLLELQPEGLENRSHTIWGEIEIAEEVTFDWNSSE